MLPYQVLMEDCDLINTRSIFLSLENDDGRPPFILSPLTFKMYALQNVATTLKDRNANSFKIREARSTCIHFDRYSVKRKP